MVKFKSSTYRYPVFPVLSIEQALLSLVCVFCTLVENHLTIDGWVYFWDLVLFHWSACVLMPVCFVVCLEATYCDASSTVLFHSGLLLLRRVFCVST
jgi:hypothetical protein